MTASVIQLPQQQLRSQDMVEELETLLVRAKAGELVAGVMILKTREGMYEHKRIDLFYEEGMGMLARAQYQLNQDWDNDRA